MSHDIRQQMFAQYSTKTNNSTEKAFKTDANIPCTNHSASYTDHQSLNSQNRPRSKTRKTRKLGLPTGLQSFKKRSQVPHITMKLVLILAFAFSLGISLTMSAEKIPEREERNAPTLDDDHSDTYRSASF